MEVSLPNMTGPQPVLLTTVICEDDARSSRDGSLSLQRVFYVLRPAALPASQAFVVVSLWWLRGAGQYAISTRVRDVDGGVLDELASDVRCDSQAIHEQSSRFVGVEFPTTGTYRIEVLLDGDVAGAYPLFVESPVSPALLPVSTTAAAVVETPIG
jgi:hypothetical protein